MISKRKLRERLLDICNGAGLIWDECDEFFDDACLENYGRMSLAVERAFDLPENSRLRSPWRLQHYEHIDSLVGLVYEAIKFDTESEAEQ